MVEYLKKVYKGSEQSLFQFLQQQLLANEKTFLVTANPETFMNGRSNPDFDRLLLDEKTVISPDGIGVVKSAQKIGIPIEKRITGVETMQDLLRFGNEKGLSAYFYGSKPETLNKLYDVLSQKYPSLVIAGMKDGYNNNDDMVFSDIIKKQPDLVFIALGVPHQELLIYKYLPEFSKGVFVGVGGAFDVISGTKKRAPELFIKMNCEWLYRILKEPSRFKRFYNSNVKYMSIISKEAKGKSETDAKH